MDKIKTKTTLHVEGMTCSNCALGVTRMLEKKGLKQVNVDFTTGEVVFEPASQISQEEIAQGIRSLGYSVNSKDQFGQQDLARRFPGTTTERLFLFSAILTLPLMLHMVLHVPFLHNGFVQLIFTTPVFLVGVYHFGRSAWSSFKTGVLNMDVLVTIGSTASYAYSIAGLILYKNNPVASQYLFFETTASIITLILLGNVIEGRSVRKTTSSLRALAAMQPSTARRVTIGPAMNEITTIVSSLDIKINDVVLLNTGDRIPVDGKIFWGDVVVDESSMTGESIPVPKSMNDMVLAGTIVLSGTAKLVTTRTAGNTALAGIIELVKSAQRSKPEIQKLGDKVSAFFVPVVVAIAVITFSIDYLVLDKSISQSIMNAVAVLVISCPCAMGLATPTAVAVGLGKAARKGILIKGGSVLEMFSKIDTVVFDKTGTLTNGNFRISELNITGTEKQHAINLIFSLEQHSSHPIAISLVKELQSIQTQRILFNNVEELKGYGMKAEDIEGNHIKLVSWRAIDPLLTNNNYSLYLLINDEIVGTIDLKDELKPGAASLITTLRNQGIKTIMLSGDREQACKKTVSELNLDAYQSEMLPADKTQYIKSLQQFGKVMMVGDGINDAPSLETADLGVSFSEATAVAINSANVIIVGQHNLEIVYDSLQIGKQTMSTIRQNLFWAFAYNIIAIPIAAAGFLSPMVAALSMAFSDVIVIGNSLRLRIRN